MCLSYYFILLSSSHTGFNQFTNPVGSTFKIIQKKKKKLNIQKMKKKINPNTSHAMDTQHLG